MKNLKKVTKQQLFLPIFCLFLVLLVNLFKDPSFFGISINNGVLYGRIIDVLNRGSEIAILAVGQTLVVAVSAGTDISVGSVMSLAACGTCMVLAGFGVNTTSTIQVPLIIGILFGVALGGDLTSHFGNKFGMDGKFVGFAFDDKRLLQGLVVLFLGNEPKLFHPPQYVLLA